MEALTTLTWMFDAVLAVLMLWIARRALSCSDLFEAIVLFIAFSLFMALSWVRLGAPDVALAEAAIGAGLTGVLLLSALVSLRSYENGAESTGHKGGSPGWSLGLHLLASVLLIAVAAGLGYVVLDLPELAEGLSADVLANMRDSGVTNPVTAVLLNFRGYDTFLEMIVLLMALLGVWSIGRELRHSRAKHGLVLDSLARTLTPIMILVAIYLLWVGGHAPGGAFQAGSVLSAAAVLLLLAGFRLRAGLTSRVLGLLLVAGPAAFLLLAVLTLVIEGRLLEYPPTLAGPLILVIETIAAVSIGATLAAIYLGKRPDDAMERR